IVPIHPLTKGLYATTMRLLVWRALEECADRMEDPVPPGTLAARGLPTLSAALREVHFPESFESLKLARRRISYEELFLLQVALARRRLHHATEDKPHVIRVD